MILPITHRLSKLTLSHIIRSFNTDIVLTSLNCFYTSPWKELYENDPVPGTAHLFILDTIGID